MNNADKPIHPSTELRKSDIMGHELTSKISHNGLTKLEHFSGLAMQGLINNTNSPNFIAEKAVELAKLLLLEFEKQKP